MSDVSVYAVEPSTRPDIDAVWDDLTVQWAPRRRTEWTVLDTFDGRLHAAGMRLAVVKGAGRALVLQGPMKAEQPLPGRVIPGRAGELPAGPVADQVRRVVGPRALLVQGVVTAMRSEAVVTDASAAAQVGLARYDAAHLTGQPASTTTWVEVTALPRSRRHARRLAARLEAVGLSCLDGDVVDATFAAAGRTFAGHENFPPVALDPDMPSAAGFRTVLDRLAETIEANWDGTVARADVEFLHDFRVAIRRTRSILGAGKQVLPDIEADAARVQLGWLAAQTSVTRDLDVYVVQWGRYTAGLAHGVVADLGPLRELLEQRLSEAYVQMAAVLSTPHSRQIILDWREWLQHSHSEVGELGHQPLGSTVAQLVLRAHRILVQRGRLITADSPAEQVHDLRKDAKRLRYLLESFATLMPEDAQRRFVKRLKVLQDNLGEHQDAEVHVLQLAEFARELQERGAGAEVLLAVGRLTERQDARRNRARKAFAARFAEYDTKATTKALFDAIDHIH